MSILFSPFTLCGLTLKNRVVMAPMTRARALNDIPDDLTVLYYRQRAGAGLIVSEGVPVSIQGRGYLFNPGLYNQEQVEGWKRVTRAVHEEGGKIFAQLWHVGRVSHTTLQPDGGAPVSSSHKLAANSLAYAYNEEYEPGPIQASVPRALSTEEIPGITNDFVQAARKAMEAGFDGVEIHAAHGYLLNQFLSPLTNRRADRWGGSLENRARILIEVIRAVRARVAASFGVGVKLNSADFQKGGFDAEDAVAVVRMLNAEAVDLVEISGGSYESPAMHGRPQQTSKRASTARREAYFLDFARDIVAAAEMPIMVTGGIRSRATAEDALAPEDGRPGVAMVGIAQALAYAPDLPNRWQRRDEVIAVPKVAWKNNLASLATMALTKLQLQRMGRGKQPTFSAWAPLALVRDQLRTRRLNRGYRNWLAHRG